MARFCSNPTTSLLCGIYLRCEAQRDMLPKNIIWNRGTARTIGMRHQWCPEYQPITNHKCTTSKRELLALPVRKRGIENPVERAGFEHAMSHLTPQQIYRQHENEKKRTYASGVMAVEQATFTTLVFTTSGDMARKCQIYHKRLEELLSAKKGEDYSTTMSWIRTRISFAILRTSLICLRGLHSIRRVNLNLKEMDLIWHRKRTFRTLDFDLEKKYWILHIKLLQNYH